MKTQRFTWLGKTIYVHRESSRQFIFLPYCAPPLQGLGLQIISYNNLRFLSFKKVSLSPKKTPL